jgi:tRNA(fMet)-specific endonuclease VapC
MLFWWALNRLSISSLSKASFCSKRRRLAFVAFFATALAKLVREFLRYTDILPWNDAIAPHYGTLRAALESSEGKRGVTIAPLDLMIAAHALAIGATLVSADPALSMTDILKVEDWSVG